MRLEIEMSNVTAEARQAIDEDLGQIDHSIGQLLAYARPAGIVPAQGVDISSVLRDLFERERMPTVSLGDVLTATIQTNLNAQTTAHNLQVIVSPHTSNPGHYVTPNSPA